MAVNRSALVYGGGCIGAVTTYLLSKSIEPQDIAIICRSNYIDVKRKGFIIHSTVWGSDLTIWPQAFQTVQEATKQHKTEYDYVFITTKGQSSKCTNTEAIAPAVSPSTTIVLMQNGIAIEAPWRQRYPLNTLLSSVLYLPVSQVKPHVFKHSLHTELHIGIYPMQTIQRDVRSEDTCAQLCDILSRGGAAVSWESDIQMARWKKVLVNGSENPICALTQLPDATFFQSTSEATQRTREIMQEIAAIARATGCRQIDDSVVEEQLSFITQRPLPGVVPSMMADAQSRRQMEVEPIVGNLLILAKETSTAVPRLELIYSLLSGLNLSYTSTPF